MKTDDREPAPIVLPWTFDTTSIWHTILKGAFTLNAVLFVAILVKVLMSQWLDALGVGIFFVVVAGFTIIFLRHQEGSRGTVFPDRVEIEPNAVLGVPLPGPRGVYPLSRFRGIQVEFRSGPVSTSPNSGGPHELVWLLGTLGIPDVVLARTQDGAGRVFGQRLSTLLGIPVQEVGAPRQIRL